MDLETARRHILVALERMRVVSMKPVFDEWAILSLPGGSGGGIVAYAGPRPDAFRRSLAADAEPLRALTSGRVLADGDMEFVQDATETRIDAFMKLGPASYLILNNTTRSLAEIRADGKWLGTQALLFELSEKFRADPLG
jgi:hypothetical protein